MRIMYRLFFSIVFVIFICSCKPFRDYKIVKNGKMYKEYVWNDRVHQIKFKVKGKYSWSAWGINSRMDLSIENNGHSEIIFNSNRSKLTSSSFNYGNEESNYLITIFPNQKDEFIPLDFSAKFSNPLSPDSDFIMPKEEKLTLYLEDIKVVIQTDTNLVSIEPIEFIPE